MIVGSLAAAAILIAAAAANGADTNRVFAGLTPDQSNATKAPIQLAPGQAQDTPDGPLYMAGEVLVKFKADATDAQLEEAVRLAGITSARQLRTPVMRARGHNGITRAFTSRPVAQAIAALRNHPAVEYAEPNWVYQHQSTDPYFLNGQLWGMYGDLSDPSNLYGSQAAEVWQVYPFATGSSEVVVGIIDEGICITHPDLQANIWVNPNETAGDGIDNDENGFVDDINGWDFYADDNSVYHDGMDQHGTHVAGTIGAIGDNGIGVVGVNWNVSMISGKFLGPNGGTTADAVAAVEYFTDLKHRGVNIVALNNSWGGGAYSQSLHDAIIRAAKEGILFVAASGNGNRAGRAINTDSSPYYPACYNTTVGTSTETAASYDAVISVTAIDSSGNKASFANYGLATVDLGAPGVNIYSTLPTATYGSYSGTSMATPHVTGAIALYASTHVGAEAPAIKTAILGSTAPTASLAGKTVTGGRLDLSTVITEGLDQTPPVAPSDLRATALSYSQIKLTWTDNSDNETRFEITRNPGGDDATTIVVGANQTSYIDSGLTADTTYTYEIQACNFVGCSQAVSGDLATARTFKYQVPAVRFVGADTDTQGSWIGKYGSEGYDIVMSKSHPTYGTVEVVNEWVPPAIWLDATTDVRCLQTPDGSSRFAACYFQFTEFYFDVNLSDDKEHRVSLYCLDWDRLERSQTITVLDGYTQGILYGPVTLESFGDGQYLTWNITGHVLIKLTFIDDTPTYPNDNAVASGIFFDPAPTAGALPTVSITFPTDGTTVLETITITADASDDGAVSAVEFFVGDKSLGTDESGSDGWSVSWDTRSVNNGTYTLTAKATDDSGQNTTSAPITVTVANSTIALPAAPTGLTATAVSRTQINLSWTDYANNEAGFKIERSSDGVKFAQIATVGADTTTYANTGLRRNTTYYYRVRAYNAAGDSAYSNVASARTLK